MLPPVAAFSDTALSQFNQSQYSPASSRVQIGNPRGDAASGSLTAPTAFGNDRRDVLSLSGQLQLAQGLSSVAEAVGSVLKLARHEGEPLSDYADRLAETIAALPPAERVALQRVLMQLFKGVTLRLLVDILRNPFGPEATRLSLQMETEAATERDPVAKLVVTSYRQNDGSGGLIGPPNRPFLATNDTTPLATVMPKALAQTEALGLTAPPPAAGQGPAAPHSNQAAALFDPEAPQQPLAAKAGQPGAPVVAADGSFAYLQETTAAESTVPGTHPQISDEIRGQTSERSIPARAGGAQEGLTANHPAIAETETPVRAETATTHATELPRPARDDVTYDGPALARQGSQRVPSASPVAAMRGEQKLVEQVNPGASGQLRAATVSAALVPSTDAPAVTIADPPAALTSDRYASIFAGDSFADEFSFGPKAAAQTSPVSAAEATATASSSTTPPATSTLNAAVTDTANLQGVLNDGADAATTDAQMLTTGTLASPQTEATGAEIIGNPSSEAAVKAAGLTVENSVYRAEALAPAAMHTATATAFVPAFVPYPVASPAAKGSGDLVRAVEAVNKDGRPGRRRNGRGREDQAGQSGQDGAADEGRPDDDLSATDGMHAESDMTATAATRDLAPTAHLSGERHGEAQDFYQRFTAW